MMASSAKVVRKSVLVTVVWKQAWCPSSLEAPLACTIVFSLSFGKFWQIPHEAFWQASLLTAQRLLTPTEPGSRQRRQTPESLAVMKGHAESPTEWRTHDWRCSKDCLGPPLSCFHLHHRTRQHSLGSLRPSDDKQQRKILAMHAA